MSEKKICPNCAALRDFKRVDRTESYTVRGEKFSFPVRVLVCAECGESLIDEKRDQALTERAFAEYRQRKGLLTPLEIQNIRERYGLSQRAFAALLGMGQPTIARYETGALQDDAHDCSIRLYANPANMKVLLDMRGHLLSAAQLERARTSTEKQPEKLDVSRWVHNGPDEYTGFRPFDFERYMKTVLWFCWKLESVPTTKMNKLLFYADYVHFKLHSASITGAAYRKLQWGPVPERHGMLRDVMEMDGYISLREKTFHDYVGMEFTAGPRAFEIELDLDGPEIEILGIVAELFGGVTSREISERSHQERAWTDTPDRHLISYMLAEHIVAPELF